MEKADPRNCRGIVDIGSNGIRFSITDLTPTTARIMPTVFQDRASISLYDAQYSEGKKQPVPDDIIADVIRALKSFKRTCEDFAIPNHHIRLVATEAMREASNSQQLRLEISRQLGWEVEMLAKEEESRIGAMGVASSLDKVNGFVMDLGGGSVQMAWMETVQGEVHVHGTTSLPYGAAALTRRMQESDTEKGSAALSDELKDAFKATFDKIKSVAQAHVEKDMELSLFLSGGGFRGWGQILMDKHRISPYPIPIINGFKVSQRDFQDQKQISSHLSNKSKNGEDIFRISNRRATQIPAISLLIDILTQALPTIKNVYFAQGGVREGILFSTLEPQIRASPPLTTATAIHAPPSWADLLDMFHSTIPSQITPSLIRELLVSFAHLLFVHTAYAKGTNASAALRSTTTGLLGSVHGLKHDQRAALGLMLCARWGGDLPPVDQQFAKQLQQLVGSEIAWWVAYVGAVGAFIAKVYPAGLVNSSAPRISSIKSDSGPTGKKGHESVSLSIVFDPSQLDGEDGRKIFKKELDDIEKVGKKKNWVGGKEGFGFKIVISTSNL